MTWVIVANNLQICYKFRIYKRGVMMFFTEFVCIRELCKLMGIRKASVSETQKILTEAMTVMHESTAGHVKPTQEKALEMIWPILFDGGYYLVYVENNDVLGWIAVSRVYDIYREQTVGMIPELYVRPAHRKRGIAEQLCQEAFRRLRAEGYRQVQLNVFSGNRVKQLYERLGFHTILSLMEKKL